MVVVVAAVVHYFDCSQEAAAKVAMMMIEGSSSVIHLREEGGPLHTYESSIMNNCISIAFPSITIIDYWL